MYCMYCGKELSPEAAFCPFCGKRQERPAAGEPVAQGSWPAFSARASQAQGAIGPAAGGAYGVLGPDKAQSPEKTQVRSMPEPVRASFVPTAAPGRGTVASRRHVSADALRRETPASATVAGTRHSGASAAVVAALAFIILAGGVFAYTRLGASSSGTAGTSASAQAGASSQGQTSETGTQAPSSSAADASKKDTDATKAVELEGLTTSGDSIVYTNPAYGYTVVLPASFQAASASAGGEGASFAEASSGIRVDVSANPNTTGATVESVLAGYTSAYDVSYQASGKNWAVASWDDGAGDVYVKAYVGENCVTTIRYTCPAASSEAGSQLIEDTVNDFKPGTL